MWHGSVCGSGGNASQLSRVQDQGCGEHRSAAVRCAPQALMETATLQAAVAGLVLHATLSFGDKAPPSAPEFTVHVGSGDYCISNMLPRPPLSLFLLCIFLTFHFMFSCVTHLGSLLKLAPPLTSTLIPPCCELSPPCLSAMKMEHKTRQ